MAFALAPLPPQTTALQLRYNPSALSCSEVISADATHPPHGEMHSPGAIEPSPGSGIGRLERNIMILVSSDVLPFGVNILNIELAFSAQRRHPEGQNEK